jgi:hypothetical protein
MARLGDGHVLDADTFELARLEKMPADSLVACDAASREDLQNRF